jgi:hypothetical protein
VGKSSKEKPKTRRWWRGEVRGIPVLVRLQPDDIAWLDAWIKRQKDRPTRPEAIRRLFRIARGRAKR